MASSVSSHGCGLQERHHRDGERSGYQGLDVAEGRQTYPRESRRDLGDQGDPGIVRAERDRNDPAREDQQQSRDLRREPSACDQDQDEVISSHSFRSGHWRRVR